MIFVDTWAWLAIAVERDQYHDVALRQHLACRNSRRRYVTSDWVLGEVITNLYRISDPRHAARFVASILAAIRTGEYLMALVSSEHFQQAWVLRQKYHDKPDISFTDLISMVMMQEMGIREIFTGDHHFEQVGLGFELVPNL